MSFRLNKIQYESSEYQTDKIELINSSNDKSSNHFTLIVGNNGTGKSRLLGSIARVLGKNTMLPRDDLFNFSKFEKTSEPSKIIAVSNSLSDKFPMNKSFRFKDSGITYREEKYNYLGTRGHLGSSSNHLIRRATDILLENYSNKNVSKCYRHVFEYLNYLPKIDLEYRIIHSELKNSFNELIEPKHIIQYIEKSTNSYSLTSSIFQKLRENYEDRFPEVCSFLNTLRSKQKRIYELKIDFSSSNISKISDDNSIYEEDLRIYEILDILRKLKMIRGFEVKLHKKGNQTFNFTNTSSGESNILTTLIALIPLVEDNCCVLIDEPEISLHPSWQYRYIELLNKIFENFKGCHIIIASHSHFIVSDLPINNSSVVSLKLIDGKVESTLLHESTFGWSAEDILLNVFEMPTTRNYYVSKIVTEALEMVAKNKKKGEKFEKIRSELSILEPKLKNEDPLKLIIKSILNIKINA